MIEVEGLVKRYGSVTAVENISFRVQEGEIVGFLGPNGAGKTTTMRILTTFLPPTSGKVYVAGYDIMEEPIKVREQIGYLPENPPLYTDMKVSSYLEFMGELRGLSRKRIKERLEYVADKCKIGDVFDKYIGHLSKGYRQRVGIAQALLHDPKILILDEPTIGLDPKQVVEVRQLIKELADTHTVMLSTHILPEVGMTCKRVLIIHRGKIIAEDTPEELAKKIKGTHTLRVEIGGADPSEIKTALENFAGIKSVRYIEVEKGAGHTFLVETEKEKDIRPELASFIIWRKWDMYELTPVGVSLEDVFLHLITKEEGIEQ